MSSAVNGEKARAPRVVHLVPRDGLGGVEAAVRSLKPEEHADLAVFYMSGPSIMSASRLFNPLAPKHGLWSPMTYWVAVRALLRTKPEVLISSLWRATMIGLIVKPLLPHTKLVVVIHAAKISHWPDWLMTSMACRFADEIWCDSEASREAIERDFKRPARSVSFRVAAEVHGQQPCRRPLDFVYWGRHAHHKQVPRAVRIFNDILAKHPEARLFVYGSDGPSTPDIKQAIAESHDPTAIQLMGAKPPGEYPNPIPSCTFFIMTSKSEGMAIAVVEAMQLGLIPIVTPVGEIANYCRANRNAVIVENEEVAVAEIIAIAFDDRKRARMSAAAVESWADVPEYSSDFKAAYNRVLDVDFVDQDV